MPITRTQFNEGKVIKSILSPKILAFLENNTDIAYTNLEILKHIQENENSSWDDYHVHSKISQVNKVLNDLSTGDSKLINTTKIRRDHDDNSDEAGYYAPISYYIIKK